MTHVLVTGATGFVGRQVVKALLATVTGFPPRAAPAHRRSWVRLARRFRWSRARISFAQARRGGRSNWRASMPSSMPPGLSSRASIWILRKISPASRVRCAWRARRGGGRCRACHRRRHLLRIPPAVRPSDGRCPAFPQTLYAASKLLFTICWNTICRNRMPAFPGVGFSISSGRANIRRGWCPMSEAGSQRRDGETFGRHADPRLPRRRKSRGDDRRRGENWSAWRNQHLFRSADNDPCARRRDRRRIWQAGPAGIRNGGHPPLRSCRRRWCLQCHRTGTRAGDL